MIAQRIGIALVSAPGIACQWTLEVSAFGYARLLMVDGQALAASGGYRLILLRNEVQGWRFEDGAKVPEPLAQVLEAAYQELTRG